MRAGDHAKGLYHPIIFMKTLLIGWEFRLQSEISQEEGQRIDNPFGSKPMCIQGLMNTKIFFTRKTRMENNTRLFQQISMNY